MRCPHCGRLLCKVLPGGELEVRRNGLQVLIVAGRVDCSCGCGAVTVAPAAHPPASILVGVAIHLRGDTRLREEQRSGAPLSADTGR